MPQNVSVRKWLVQNSYTEVAEVINAIMDGWKIKGTKPGVIGGTYLLVGKW